MHGDFVDVVDSYRFSDCRAKFGRTVYINGVQPFQLNSNRIMFQEWRLFVWRVSKRQMQLLIMPLPPSLVCLGISVMFHIKRIPSVGKQLFQDTSRIWIKTGCDFSSLSFGQYIYDIFSLLTVYPTPSSSLCPPPSDFLFSETDLCVLSSFYLLIYLLDIYAMLCRFGSAFFFFACVCTQAMNFRRKRRR